MPNIKFNAIAQSQSPTRTLVKTRNFELTIDEPENLGGTNAGPNPVEYILAALAGCLNVVGHLVAKEMGFTVNGISIDIEGVLDPAKFMGKPTQERAGYSNIHVTLKPDTQADKETLETWIKNVESRCPVSDNITNATDVDIVLG